MPGLRRKYNTHEEETSINNLFAPVKDDIVLPSLVPLHFVNLVVLAGYCEVNYFKHKQKASAGWGLLCSSRFPQDNAADLSQHLTALQGCARRASLIPSLQGFLRHRTQSDCVPSLYWMSVSIYSFLFVIIVMRS